MSTEKEIHFFPDMEGNGWKTKIPSRERLGQILAGYFGQGAKLTKSEGGQHGWCWEYQLPGNSSQEVDWFNAEPRVVDPEMEATERLIEVRLLDHRRQEDEFPIGWAHVTTRGQDPFVMALADGLVRVIVRHANGRTLNPNN